MEKGGFVTTQTYHKMKLTLLVQWIDPDTVDPAIRRERITYRIKDLIDKELAPRAKLLHGVKVWMKGER
jgi:hypothetical protein